MKKPRRLQNLTFPKTLPATALAQVRGGDTIDPCIRTIQPCVRTIEPCVRTFDPCVRR